MKKLEDQTKLIIVDLLTLIHKDIVKSEGVSGYLRYNSLIVDLIEGLSGLKGNPDNGFVMFDFTKEIKILGEYNE